VGHALDDRHGLWQGGVCEVCWDGKMWRRGKVKWSMQVDLDWGGQWGGMQPSIVGGARGA
jgi:hypothetical protein